jgi:hypothetical protein
VCDPGHHASQGPETGREPELPLRV